MSLLGKTKLINKILKESGEDNLFKPRRLEPREEKSRLEREKLDLEIKFYLDGRIKLIIDSFKKFIKDNNLTILVEDMEKNDTNIFSAYHDPKNNTKYWLSIYIKAEGRFNEERWNNIQNQIDTIAWRANALAERKEQEFYWEFFAYEDSGTFILDIDYNF